MENNIYQDRVEKAVGYFREGYNCSQSVFLAFADLYGVEKNLGLRMASSFGGGIGRMRETCGAASGMFMLAGLQEGYTNPSDKAQKNENYRLVQQLAAEFREINGSIKCGDLLAGNLEKKMTYVSEDRTPEYYKKRPCVELVRSAAQIWADFLYKNNVKLPKSDV